MARRVVIVGVHRGNTEVEAFDTIQMQGRAGRKGIDERGDAYILLPKSRFIELREKYKVAPPIISRMMTSSRTGIDNLIFHSVSEIAEGNISTIKDFIKWHSRSLASFQGCQIDEAGAGKIFELLEKIKAVKKEGYGYVATGLGRIASVMYMNPYDVFAWYKNFGQMNAMPRDKVNNTVICWALSNCRMYDSGYVSKPDTDLALSFVHACKKLSLEIANSRAVSGKILLEGLGDKSGMFIEDFRVFNAKSDIERVLQTISMIDTMYTKWGMEDFFKRLLIRFTYGVPDYLVELCTLKGIGAMRASILYRSGIKTKDDVYREREKFILALGGNEKAEKIYEDAIKRRLRYDV